MILVYVDNKRFGEVSDLPFTGRVAYRNPKYFKEVEKCDGVYVHGNYPNIEQAYEGKIIRPIEEMGSSSDYTIAELRRMKPDIEDWTEFTKNDTRKSVSQI